MTNENNGRRKRVVRQSWKPGVFLNTLHGVWTAAYSVLKIALGALATVLVIGVVCVFAFMGILANYLKTDILPGADTLLENFETDQTSYVYYLDGDGNIQILQRLYGVDSEWATYDEIPKHLINATVAIEDKRFYEHQGVDWFTTIKACLNLFMGGESEFGGSCITQQLIKNLYHEDDVTVQRKVLEIFRAREFERRYDKKTVLEWYLNIIPLGGQITGVKAAAEEYFGKELENLTIAECASLISITNNPSRYNPYRTLEDKGGKTGAERNRERQLTTLNEMHEQGWITDEEYEEAKNQEMVFKRGIDDADKMLSCANEECGYRGTVGSYTPSGEKYLCPQCGTENSAVKDDSKYYYSWFVDAVLDDVAMEMCEQDGMEWNKENKETYLDRIKMGGYHIYTTLDMEVQEAIDRIYTNLDEIPDARSLAQLQSGIVVIDNRTGDVVGMAGGVGEKDNHDGYHRANDARLQPGSAMKPISVYAPAFEMGAVTPATVIPDMPLYYTDGNPFPRNNDRVYGYSRIVLTGLTSSVNGIAINTLNTIGTAYSFDFAKNSFGLSMLTDYYVDRNGNIYSDENLAPLGLGAPTIGVTVRQMSAAYATFANDGVYREARTFTKVYDSDGKLVLDNEQDSRKILSHKANQYMNFCLDATADILQGGSGWNGDFEGHDVAAKTGTTTGTKDRWYCGYTGYYTAAVWVGYDTPETVNLVGDQTNPAGRLWRKVMEPLHKGLERLPLYNEDEFVTVQVCLDCGNLATEACRYDARAYDNGLNRVATSKVFPEDVPDDPCQCHVMVEFCQECNAVANEYCKLLAEYGEAVLIKRALVTMTYDQINDIKEASKHGLQAAYYKDNYIYYVDEDGDDRNFKGIFGTANQNVQAPYLVCYQHTREDCLEYLQQNPGGSTEGTETNPTEQLYGVEP